MSAGPKRFWGHARGKVDREGRCRVCKRSRPLQAAHVVGRANDPAIEDVAAELTNEIQVSAYDRYVRAEAICPLCLFCHQEYDSGALDLLPYLKLDEQLQAVRDAGGIEKARRRTAPTAYRVGGLGMA